MITIRAEQLAVLGDARASRFAVQVEAHIRQVFAEECAALGRETVTRLVAAATAQARTFGMDDQYDVLHYVSLTFLLGADFAHDEDWAREIMADTRFGPATRLAMIEEELDRQEAEDQESSPAPEDSPHVG